MEHPITEFGINGAIGSAFTDADSNILVADESVYKYLGQNFPVNLSEHIWETDKDTFLDLVSHCGDTPRFMITKFRRFDGEYRDASLILQYIPFKSESFIHIEMFDIADMTADFKRSALNAITTKTYTDISHGIFFNYDTESENILLLHDGKILYDGNITKWCDKVISEGYISSSFVGRFYMLCDAVKEANDSGYFTLDTSFFSDKKEFLKTSAAFCVIDTDTVPLSTAGIFKNGEFSDRSFFDPLTGIYNKGVIKEIALASIANADKNGSSVVFIIIDLDHFKEINDLYGHLTGDKALMNAARIIKNIIGNRGTLGRIGGDEFFAVIPDHSGDIEELRSLLRTIRMHIQWFFAHFKDDVKVTCSIGSVCYPQDADNYNDLFKLADFCLYRAKTKGRNRFITFNPEVHGPAEKILNNSTNMQFAGLISDDEKIEHLLSLISLANAADSGFLDTLLAEIKHYYDVNTIQFCPAVSGRKYMESSDREIIEPIRVLEVYDTYKGHIDSDGQLTLGHYMNARSMFPELAEFMEKNEMSSILICPCTDEIGRLEGIFVLTSDIQYTWSGFDVRNMQILCKIMERFI